MGLSSSDLIKLDALLKFRLEFLQNKVLISSNLWFSNNSTSSALISLQSPIDYDFSHNLIVQCEGVTNFKVWDEVKDVFGSGGVVNNPIRTRLEMDTEPIIDVDMESGDAIWIPKHFPHLATSLTPRLSVSFPLAQCTDVNTVREDRNWITL